MLQIHKMNTFIMLYTKSASNPSASSIKKKEGTLLGINSSPPEDRPLEKEIVEITIFRDY